jgi:hypothetical protein
LLFWQESIFELIRISQIASSCVFLLNLNNMCLALVHVLKERRWKKTQREVERKKANHTARLVETWLDFMSCAIKRNRHDLNSLLLILLYNFRLFIFRGFFFFLSIEINKLYIRSCAKASFAWFSSQKMSLKLDWSSYTETQFGTK